MTDAAPLPTDAAASTSASTSAPTSTASIDQAVGIPKEPPALPFEHYYTYCFHLSPTFSRFCPMRVRDLLRLDQYDAFEGQNICFHLNHPIKWVRVCGVVVDVADYGSRQTFTLDDGSGTTIECVSFSVRPSKPEKKPLTDIILVAESAAEEAEHVNRVNALRTALVGKVVQTRGELFLRKGGCRVFLQIISIKHKILHSTQQEVQFWNKVNTFTRDTLNKPWVVDKQIVRECRAKDEQSRPKHCASRKPETTPCRRLQAEVKQPSAPAPRVSAKKWQIKPEPREDDAPMADISKHELMQLDDGDVEIASEEAESQASCTQRRCAPSQTEPMHVDDQPPRRRLPKKWDLG